MIEEGQKPVDEVTQQIMEAKTKIENTKARIEQKIQSTREKAEAKVDKYKNKYKETKEKVEKIKAEHKNKYKSFKKFFRFNTAIKAKCYYGASIFNQNVSNS